MKGYVFRDEFSRNVLKLVSGATVAQAIPIALSPLLTRLYSPEEFGVFALYFAIVSLFGTISNGRFELAVALPATEGDALDIAALAVVVSIGLAGLLLLIVLLFASSIAELLGEPALAPWLYLVPFAVAAFGVSNALTYLCNRWKAFGVTAHVQVSRSIVLATVQLVLGFLWAGAAGLIVGHVISMIAGAFWYARATRQRAEIVFRLRQMREMAWRFADFPRFSMPAALANTLAHQSTSFLISMLYSTASLGYYSLIQRVLDVPSSLIGVASGHVLYQQAGEERRKHGTAVNAFEQALLKLMVIGLPTFIALFFIVEDLFAFAFGEPWRVAGVYARILTPLFAIRFLFGSVSNIINVFEKQRIALAWQVGFLLISIGTFYVGHAVSLAFDQVLVVLTAAVVLLYVFLYFLMRQIVRGRL